ncbi:efflux RND transporter periplasmic adaptor subunit [bacterium]|nr:efflux RND transporter periplasmic adaptor subunit [bacterium]
MKKIIIISLIILFTLGLLCFLYCKHKKTPKITTFGNIEIRTVDLSFQVSGTIKEVFKEEGDYVNEGDLIAILDDRDYLANYKKALSQKNANLAQMKEDTSKYQRNIPLCKEQALSEQECTTLLNKKDLSKAQFEESVANSDFQKNQLEYTKLFAPQEGTITVRAQEKGAKVNANQTVYVMSLLKPIWIRTYIKETDLGNIKYGKEARILTDTIDAKTKKPKTYKGQVGFISPVAEFTPKTVQTEDLRVDLVYRIRVYIDEPDEYLRQGMPVTVEFDLDE